jgi:hypothetical protein
MPNPIKKATDKKRTSFIFHSFDLENSRASIIIVDIVVCGGTLPVILEVHENVNMQNLNPNLLRPV